MNVHIRRIQESKCDQASLPSGFSDVRPQECVEHQTQLEQGGARNRRPPGIMQPRIENKRPSPESVVTSQPSAPSSVPMHP